MSVLAAFILGMAVGWLLLGVALVSDRELRLLCKLMVVTEKRTNERSD